MRLNRAFEKLRKYKTGSTPQPARIHTCRDNENFSPKSLILCQSQKLPAVALAEIKIKEHNVNSFAPQNLQSVHSSSKAQNV
jgi:hypothetical protein